MVSQSAMGVDSQVRPCPLCQALGRTGVLILRQINIDEAIYVCTDNQCIYPVAVGSTEAELVKRHISEWDEADVIDQLLEKNTRKCAPIGTSHNEVKHPPSVPAHQLNDPTLASHDYRTADPAHQLYGSSHPLYGHYQPHSLNCQPYDQAGLQQQHTYGSSHQSFGQIGNVGHQGYAHDGTLGQFAGTSHEPCNQYGQHSIGSSHQPHGGFSAFSAQCRADSSTTAAAAGQYGWPGYHPSASQSFQVDAHLGYEGNQACGGDQPVDEMDSFIDSLFQC